MRCKKGQFYVLMSIMLIVYMFMILMPESKPRQQTSSFKQLYTNFLTESSSAINSGIYDENLTTRFKNFSSGFMAYAKTKDPGFKMTYALLDEGQMTVSNTLGEQMNVSTSAETFLLDPGTDRLMNKTSNLTLRIRGVSYGLTFTKDTELKAIFMKTDKGEVMIHVEN